MTQISKQLIIELLIGCKDIQNIIKGFLFHTEDTSPTVLFIRQKKRSIVNIFNGPYCSSRANNSDLWTNDPDRCIFWKFVMVEQQGFLRIEATNCKKCGGYIKDYYCYGEYIYASPIICNCAML